MKQISRFFVLAVACLAIFGCTKSNGVKKISSSASYNLNGCTALYNGVSTFSEVNTTDLVLYSTETDGEYYIPKFFQGDGGIEFYWDTKTNDVSIKAGYAGVSTALTAMEIGSQAEYDALMGESALKSFYDPSTSTFTFNVLIVMSDGYGSLSKVTTTLYFKITSEVE